MNVDSHDIKSRRFMDKIIYLANMSQYVVFEIVTYAMIE